MAELIDVVPRSALAVFAHPDDSDVACGGTLAAWARKGCETHVVICAVGDKGTDDPTVLAENLVEVRRAELENAQRLLGVTRLHRLEHRDGELDNDLALRCELVGIIRSVRPEVLICPDPSALFFGEHYFNHRDHRIVGYAALDAAAPAAALPKYFPESGSPFAVSLVYLAGSLEPTVYVDVTSTIEEKAEAILCHESQLKELGADLASVVRERAGEAGRAVGVSYAEGFRRIRLGP